MDIHKIETKEDIETFKRDFPTLTDFFESYINEDVFEPESEGELPRTIDTVVGEYTSFHTNEDLLSAITELNKILETYSEDNEVEKALDILGNRFNATYKHYPSYRAWLEHLVDYFTKEAEKKAA